MEEDQRIEFEKIYKGKKANEVIGSIDTWIQTV